MDEGRDERAGHRGQAKRSSVRKPDRRAGADTLIVGRLQAHGPAPYQFRSGQDASYFVKLQTDRGERVLWGKDLERALKFAYTQPAIGDRVGAQRVARRAVTVVEKQRDASGRVVKQQEHHAHRNEWRVEKVQFFAERAKLARRVRDAQADVRETVRAHPELKSTFLTLRAAEELAARRIADPKDRERFLALIKGAITNSIEQGEPLPEVRLKERRAERAASKPSPSRDRSDRTR